jgi:folate-binding protein YgfZ
VGDFFASFHVFRPAAWLKISGEDAFGFLQGQFTNELRGEPRKVTYGLWLNQKGRVLADSHVLREESNQFRVLSDHSLALTIVQRLEQYIIADDVVVQDETEKVWALAIWSSESNKPPLKDLVWTAPAPGEFQYSEGVWIIPGRRNNLENYELIGPEAEVGKWRKKLLAAGGVEVGADAMELARISSGVPSVPQDIGPGDLPNEAGLETNAISFTKGCYLGQEVMARLKNMGKIRRQLRRIRGKGPAPKAGASLFQEAKKVGEIRSAISTAEGFAALGMLTHLGLDETQGFTFEPTAVRSADVDAWMS